MTSDEFSCLKLFICYPKRETVNGQLLAVQPLFEQKTTTYSGKAAV